MKKMLILAGAVMLIAAACNSQQSADLPTPVHKAQTNNSVSSSTNSSVDATVNALNAGADAEDSANMKSDSDVTSSDQSVINNYNGVSNATSF